MEDRPRELDVREVSWTLRHPLTTRLTLEIPINRPHPWIHQTTHLRLASCFVHDLGVLNLGHGDGFL